jgi:hypothetical protein
VIDVFLPRTDAGVAVQAAIWLLLTIVALYLSRRHAEIRLFVVGVSVLTLGLMAVRAVH